MKKILAASMFLAIVLTGCTTVKGLGEGQEIGRAHV